MPPPNATMESFSFLKFLRSVGGGGATAHTTASVLCPSNDTEEDEHDQDDGPFFDFEFAAVTDDGDGNGEGEEWEEKNRSEAYRPTGGDAEAEEEEEVEVEREFNFAVSAEGSGGAEGVDGQGFDAFSPSNDLFFKGKLLPFDPSSAVIAAVSEADAKHQIPAYILRTATKVRVFFLGLRKTKPSPSESNAAVPEAPALTAAEVAASPKKGQPQLNKFFVKFKVVDVPFGSSFARDGSTRSGGGSREANPMAEEATAAAMEAEKKLVKEMVQKYLNKIKPLYVRVSRKYAERLRLAVHLPPTDEAVAETAAGDSEETDEETEVTAPPLQQSAGNATGPTLQPGNTAGARGRVFTAGLRVVCKRLRKSRSASAATAAMASSATRRRDDSLLQQQDGIQSAIAHCKRSFTAAEQGSESPLVRSMSDPGNASST